MELNKYDSHATLVDNPNFQEDVSPRESSNADVICVRDSHAPWTHNDAHVPNTNSRDYDGNQPPIMGKHTIEAKGIEETEKASKRVQTSDGDHYILAEATVQSHQSQ